MVLELVSHVGLWLEVPGDYGTGQEGNTSLLLWLFCWAVEGQATTAESQSRLLWSVPL